MPICQRHPGRRASIEAAHARRPSFADSERLAYDRQVIFITAKFRVRPEHADDWADITKAFTDATRAEHGNLWFDWSRSLDDPTEYVLVEAFRDSAAGTAHVESDHFAEATKNLPAFLAETPRIVSQMLDQTDWSELGEMRVD
jgi:quinol monooxygenase YgiN